MPERQIRSVALAMEGEVGRTALFDWVEVTGTESRADAARAPETVDGIRSLPGPKNATATEIAPEGLTLKRAGEWTIPGGA